MSAKEILEKYVDLEKSWLSDTEKKDVMDMLYKHKDAFSLRDEICTYPTIQVKRVVADKPPFCNRTNHIKEEDKDILDRQMKILCY